MYCLQGSKLKKWRLIIRNLPFMVLTLLTTYLIVLQCFVSSLIDRSSFCHLFPGLKTSVGLCFDFCSSKNKHSVSYFHHQDLCGTSPFLGNPIARMFFPSCAGNQLRHLGMHCNVNLTKFLCRVYALILKAGGVSFSYLSHYSRCPLLLQFRTLFKLGFFGTECL